MDLIFHLLIVELIYLYLFIAVIFEVIGTTALQASQQFTKTIPLIITICSYTASFFFFSLVLRVLPVGIAYAIWSGLGIVLISVIGFFRFNQKLDIFAILGLGLIITGVLVVNIFSKSVMH